MKKRSLVDILFEQEEAPIEWESKYESFVNALGNNASDPKMHAFIGAGLKDGDMDDDKFEFNPSQAIPVKALKPTQQEVDVDKSLSWPLEKEPEAFVAYTTSNGPFTLGSPIVTFNGEYVIDGHHRWAAVVNVDAADGTLGQDSMPVVVIDLSIHEALADARAFTADFGILAKSAKKIFFF